MNEEEKKAIEELEEFIKGPCEICKYCEGAYKLNRKNIIQLLNLIKKLQKENEELKDIDLTTVHIKGVCDEKDRWRNKIRELILNKKQKIQENSKEIEECRKTIMEEQELKKLKLYTLHKNNDLLELEIADLFNLLKEE